MSLGWLPRLASTSASWLVPAMAESVNPWVAVAQLQVERSTTMVESLQLQEQELPAVTGLAAPTPALVSPPAPAQRYPREQVAAGQMGFIGTHGGSGASTLASVFGLPRVTRTWPISMDGPTYVFLVCRSNVKGLQSAQLAAREWASGSVPGVVVLGLIVIADAPGRLPKELRAFAQQIGGGVPRIWHVGWYDQLRTSTDVSGLAQGPLREFSRDLHLLRQHLTNQEQQ